MLILCYGVGMKTTLLAIAVLLLAGIFSPMFSNSGMTFHQETMTVPDRTLDMGYAWHVVVATEGGL